MTMNSYPVASANGGPVVSEMAFQNGTPPAQDMSAVPPPSGVSQDQAKTTLW